MDYIQFQLRFKEKYYLIIIRKPESNIKNCLNSIIDPMIDCMRDKEERVRYTAIEYLFLTSKLLGDVVLIKLEEIYRNLV